MLFRSGGKISLISVNWKSVSLQSDFQVSWGYICPVSKYTHTHHKRKHIYTKTKSINHKNQMPKTIAPGPGCSRRLLWSLCTSFLAPPDPGERLLSARPDPAGDRCRAGRRRCLLLASLASESPLPAAHIFCSAGERLQPTRTFRGCQVEHGVSEATAG